MIVHPIDGGASYLGVAATDHVIESLRNRVWQDYKTGAGRCRLAGERARSR